MRKKQIIIFISLLLFLCPLQQSLGDSENPPDGTQKAGSSISTYQDEELIRSMGLPSKYEPYAGPMLTYDGQIDEWGGHALGGVNRYLLNPNFGIGLAGEGYLGIVDGDTDYGVRLLGVFDFLFIRGGLDYSFRSEETDFILSASFPLKRGGLFGRGDSFRLDWIPGRDHSFNVGLTIPLWQPYKGKTRPKQDRVSLPEHRKKKKISKEIILTDQIESVLEKICHAAGWVNKYITPFFDQELSREEDELSEFREKVQTFKEHLTLVDDEYPQGHTFNAEVMSYHRAVNEAFALALGGNSAGSNSLSERIALKAREVLLNNIIIPYNRVLGQNKRNDSLTGYGSSAKMKFAEWLDDATGISSKQRDAVLYVFEELVEIMDENRAGSKKVWKDSKLVWIPLQYGLNPSDYDSQKKMDDILDAVAADEFVQGNDIYYVINEQFQAEVARMILEAEDYHVLWIHDYRGVTPSGNPDRIGYAMTLFGYLAAMIRRVKAYDDTGKLPVYVIFIDQYYYEENKGKLWLELLQDPLRHDFRLPPGYEEWEQRIREAQDELREAVTASSRLQAQSKQRGEAWLFNMIKVHVNVTNPSDFSFRSARLIDNFPVAPDNLMRDHRKVSFYDVTELDPGKGEAIYGGLGIGEHYAGPTWGDRSILVRGPILVSLKDAARRVLLQQGFKEKDIPPPLRKQPRPADYDQKIKALEAKGWNARVMDVHNETGFRSKPINTIKATLYSLMPPGSTIIVPDSLWNSPFWGGMLTGAALRGCRVMVIAPALENAPSAGFPQMSRAYELFSRLIIVGNVLSHEIAAAGGMLKVGKFAPVSDVGDIRAALREFKKGIERYPFLKEVFPFDPDVYDAMDRFDAELETKGFKPTYYTEDIEKRRPKLHIKVNFFASKEMQDLLSLEGWDDLMLNYGHYRASIVGRKEVYVDVKDIPEELEETANRLLNTYWGSLSQKEKERVIYFLTVGSQNQDYRGTIMDGEVASVVSGQYALVGLVDLFFTAGLTTWVDNIEELDELLPPERGWRRWVGRYIMKAL